MRAVPFGMPSLEQLEKLLASDPNDPFVLYGIAQEHAKSDDHAKAIEFFDRCLASDPTYLYAYYHKAMSQEASGDAEAAKTTLRIGVAHARETGDAKAQGEMAEQLERLEG